MCRNVLVALVLSVLAAGCLDREAAVKRLRTDDPRIQAATIARIVRENDATMAGELIDLLESEDEGVRFMAATGLHKLTGTDRGFHFANQEKRKQIVAEWRSWWQAAGGAPAPANEEAGPKDATDEGKGNPSNETSKESRL